MITKYLRVNPSAICIKLFLGMLLAMGYFTANAMPVITSAIGTNGTCVSDCKITINATNLGTGVKYALINYPSVGLTRTQDENVFIDLEPGTYTVGVYDNTTTTTGPVTTTVTVTTSYQEMYLNQPGISSVASNYCNDNGTLTISFTGGKAPFRYKITGPITREVTNNSSRSYAFSGLPTGSYEIEVEDACGQWRQNKPGEPIQVTSATNTAISGVRFTKLETKRTGTYSYVIASNSCTPTVNVYFAAADIVITTKDTITDVVKTFSPNSSSQNVQFKIEVPAKNWSSNWVTAGASSSLYTYFSGVPYVKGGTFHIRVKHPCTGEEVVSENTHLFPPEPGFEVVSLSNSGSYTDFCHLIENPMFTIRPKGTGNDIIRGFGCGPYTFVLKENEQPDLTFQSTGTGNSFNFNKNAAQGGLQGGHTYYVEVYQGTGADTAYKGIVGPIAVSMVPDASANYTYYYYGHGYYNTFNNTSESGINYYAYGRNYGRSNDFNTTALYAYRYPTSASGSSTYTIMSAPAEASGFVGETKTLTTHGFLWTELPFGTYTIKAEYPGCTERTETVTLTKYFYGFDADELTYTEDPQVCGMSTIKGTAYFRDKNNSKLNITSSYERYYMQIVEGPNRSDGTSTVGLRSGLTYSSSSYAATISNLPGGTYKVIFYSENTYPAPAYSNSRYSVPEHKYDVERTITIREYNLPKLDIPNSGGISCSDLPGSARLTITAVGDKSPFQYRYKPSTGNDEQDKLTSYPDTWSDINYFDGLEPGYYLTQVKDQCGSITTQRVKIFNGGDQFVEIIGAADNELGETIICEGQAVRLQVMSIGPVLSHQWFKSVTGEEGTWDALTDAGQHPTYDINSVSVGDEGFYKVVIHNSACDISSKLHIVGVEQPLPSPGISGPTGVCPGTNFTLTAITDVTEPHTFQWYKVNGTINEPIVGSYTSAYTTNIAGKYTVAVIPSIGCPSNPSDVHTVEADTDYCIKANSDTIYIDAGDVAKIADVLANDKTNGCDVTFTIASGPSNGTAATTGDKRISYTPNSTFTGVDELTYKIACGADEATAKLTIVVKSDIVVVSEDAQEPDKPGKFTFKFSKDGVVYSKNLIITYRVVSDETTAQAAVDYTNTLTGTVTLPQGSTKVDVLVTPIDNYIVQGNDRKIKIEIVSVEE